MARGVQLDRWKRYEVQHGVGAPVGSTKGNIYINDVNSDIYTRKINQSAWVLATAAPVWQTSGGIISPVNTDDGLSVNATGTNEVNIAAEAEIHISSSSDIVRLGSAGSSSYLSIDDSGSTTNMRNTTVVIDGVSTDTASTVTIGHVGYNFLRFRRSDDNVTLSADGDLEVGSGEDLILGGEDSATLAAAAGHVDIQAVNSSYEVYLTAHGVSTAYNSAGAASLTTTAQSLVGAINEIDARFSGGFTGTVGSPTSITVVDGIVTSVS